MNEYRSHLRLFTPNARLFLFAMSVLAFGTAPSTLFLNLYFEKIGLNREFIGLVNTVIQVGGALAILPAALLLDRIGRRAAILIGGYSATFAWALAVLTPIPNAILLLLAINGAGIGLFGLAVVPLLAESSTTQERTTLFSVSEGTTTLALFVGSVLSGFVALWLAPLLAVGAESAEMYRTILLGSAAIRLVGMLPLILIWPTPKSGHGSDHAKNITNADRVRFASFFNLHHLVRLKTPILLYGIPVFLVYFAGSLIFPFLSLFIKERFGVSDSITGTVLGLLNLSIGAGALLAPLAVHAIGRGRVVIGGALASALALAVIGFTPLFVVAATVIVLRAGVFNAIIPLYRAYVIDGAPPEEYTIVVLLLSLCANIGPALGPALSGRIQMQYGFSPAFVIAIAGYALAALIYGLIFAWGNPKARR